MPNRQTMAQRKLQADGLCRRCAVEYATLKADGTPGPYCIECRAKATASERLRVQKRKAAAAAAAIVKCAECPNALPAERIDAGIENCADCQPPLPPAAAGRPPLAAAAGTYSKQAHAVKAKKLTPVYDAIMAAYHKQAAAAGKPIFKPDLTALATLSGEYRTDAAGNPKPYTKRQIRNILKKNGEYGVNGMYGF